MLEQLRFSVAQYPRRCPEPRMSALSLALKSCLALIYLVLFACTRQAWKRFQKAAESPMPALCQATLHARGRQSTHYDAR